MSYTQRELVRLINEKISLEECLTHNSEAEKESFIGGMKMILDLIQNPSHYDDDHEEEVTDEDTAEIARLVSDGMTSGILDSEGCRTSWELTISKFKD